MHRSRVVVAAAIAVLAPIGWAQDGPYKVQKTAKVGGLGGFDYVYADEAGRRLYVARTGPSKPALVSVRSAPADRCLEAALLASR